MAHYPDSLDANRLTAEDRAAIRSAITAHVSGLSDTAWLWIWMSGDTSAIARVGYRAICCTATSLRSSELDEIHTMARDAMALNLSARDALAVSLREA